MQPEGGQRGLRRPILAALGALVLLAAIAAVAAALDLGPFGGGDEDDGAVTKAEFVSRGDEICKQAHAQFEQLQENPPNTARAAAELQRKLIGVSEAELTDIRELDAPPEVEPALDRYLRAREQGIALLKRGLRAAENEDPQAFSAAMAELASGQVHRLKLAQAVGFTECSRPSPQAATTGQ